MKHIQPISIAKTKWVLTLLGIAIMFCAQAQDGVGINTTTIDPHAILDIANPSGTKGVKFPVSLHDDITSLQDPSTGILIFDRDANQLYNSVLHTDSSGNDIKEFDAIGWGMRGNMFLDSSKHYLGTQDNNSFIISANGLGNGGGNLVISPDGKIGVNMYVSPLLSRPRAALDINGSIILGSDYNVEEPGALQYDSNDDIMMYFSPQGGWTSLGGGGGGGSDNDWTIGSGVVYNLTDNVGIGTIGNNNYQLYLNTPASGNNSIGLYSVQAGTHSGSGFGLYSQNNMNTNGTKYGIYNNVNSYGTGERYGMLSLTTGNSSSSSNVYGLYSYVLGGGTGIYYGLRLNNSGSGSGEDYGIYSTGEDYNYFEGSVGIGISSPTSNLHIQGSTTSYLTHFNNTTTTGGYGIISEITTSPTSSGNRYGIYSRAWFGQSTNYGGYFHGYGGTTSYGIFATSGGSSSSSYAGYFSGSVFTTGTYQTSDRKLKKGIKDYENALDLLDQITIHSYTYKQNGNYKKMNLPEGEQVGFMAENMEQVFPSLVKKTEFDFNQLDDNMMPVDNAEPNIFEFNAVNYVGMVPVLAKAIQEQQQLIETQQAQIDELKKEMEELKSN